jgi:hypothetical protein
VLVSFQNIHNFIDQLLSHLFVSILYDMDGEFCELSLHDASYVTMTTPLVHGNWMCDMMNSVLNKSVDDVPGCIQNIP